MKISIFAAPIKARPFLITLVIVSSFVLISGFGISLLQNKEAISWSEFGPAMLFGMMAGIIPTIFVGGLLIGRLTHELGQLKKGLEKIRQGASEYRINAGSSDEVEAIQRGINLSRNQLERTPGKHEEVVCVERASAKEPRQPTEVEAPKKVRKAKKNVLADGCPGRILVVEDMELNQKIVALMLEKLGYEVSLANNGREAIDALTGNQVPDVVFMDLQMPEMGGLDAAKEIRGNLHLAKQPIIIAMTGDNSTGVRESCLKAGMDDFLAKPVSIEDLSKSIESATP